MSETVRPVVVAIPHFNNTASLANLIPQVGEQDYDGIYVIDDASDREEEQDALADLRHRFTGDGVVFMQNPKNIGAGATRNCIMEVEKINNQDTLIHYLDSDVTLETSDAPAIIQDTLTVDSGIGMFGGLVRTPDGHQHPLNFGSSFTFAAAFGATTQLGADYLARKRANKSENTEDDLLSKARDLLLPAWPNTSKPPEARDAFWVLEANLAISSLDLRGAGGFGTKRAHDVQGLAIRLSQQGFTARFDPRVAVTHLDLGKHPNALKDQIEATFAINKEFSWGRYLLGDTIAG